MHHNWVTGNFLSICQWLRFFNSSSK
nr:hypothetical protein CTRU02_10527 [Colletotrichum truncatum]